VLAVSVTWLGERERVMNQMIIRIARAARWPRGSAVLVLEYATGCSACGGTRKTALWVLEAVGSHEGKSAFHTTLIESISS
jgi:hypothetical protein